MFANFGPGHWAVVAVVMILLFGAKKLPDAARSLGTSLRIFKSELGELHDHATSDTPGASPSAVATERIAVPAAEQADTGA